MLLRTKLGFTSLTAPSPPPPEQILYSDSRPHFEIVTLQGQAFVKLAENRDMYTLYHPCQK